MARSCLNCKYAKLLPFGDNGLVPFCTIAPPKLEVLRDKPPAFTLLSWYPPIPQQPCAQHKRKWFGAIKLSDFQAKPVKPAKPVVELTTLQLD